ncbi:MAG: Crp/Fnr family transcriptional regulator [Acidobacteriia bacterium]|nr:Crp/Fnr family transcriptional regulator [Terriglobia bacterium]
MISDLSALRKCPMFANLDPKELERIGFVMQERTFGRNQIIFGEEEAGQYMYVIKRGLVKVWKMTEDGREQILAVHGAGQSFGELSLIDGKSTPASVTAINSTTIYSMSKADFVNWIVANHAIFMKIVESLCDQIRTSWSRLHALTMLSTERKIMYVLSELSLKHGVRTREGVLINLRLKHKDLANMVVASRETVTRFLTQFQKKGLIAVNDGQITIKQSLTLPEAGPAQ